MWSMGGQLGWKQIRWTETEVIHENEDGMYVEEHATYIE